MRRLGVFCTLIVVGMVLSLTGTVVSAQDGVGLESDDQLGVDTAPSPLSPNAKVYDLAPTFHFSQLFGATKYKIEVWDDYTDTLIYTYKGVTCQVAGVPCELTPDVQLKALNYNGTKGLYRWRVKAKINGSWQLQYSTPQTFTVMSPGFYHDFSVLPTKWKVLWGEWLVNKWGYLKTPGTPGAHASLFHKEVFEDTDFHPVFEVVMKRKTDSVRGNGILVAGIPGDSPQNGWQQGYVLDYSNNGFYELYLAYSDGVAKGICSGSTQGVVNLFGWNKLTIWQNYPFLTAWINEELVCNTYIADDIQILRTGGIGVFEIGSTGTVFLVDSAELYYSPDPPYLIADGN